MTFAISAARSIFAVLAGVIALTAVAFALEMPLWWLVLRLFSDRFPDQTALQTHIAWQLSQFLYTVPGGIAGGYVAAWLAPHHKLGHAIAMAALENLLIVALIFNPPHPIPAWMWAAGLIITPAAIIAGGYLREKTAASHVAK